MLLPTHLRAGIQFGLLIAIAGIAGAFSYFGDMPTLLTILVAISGAVFGSQFPDIDHPTSIPRKHHKLIGAIFEAFHVHHRGRYSHSLLSQTLTWLIALMLVNMVVPSIVKAIPNASFFVTILFTAILGSQLDGIITNFVKFFRSDAVRGYGMGPMIMFIMTDDKYYAKEAHFKGLNERDEMTIKIVSYVLVFIALSTMLILNGKDVAKFTTPLLSVYVIAIYAGVLSHLLMDVSTKAGIYLDWRHKFSPAKMMMNNPYLRWLTPASEFRTGSSWETSVRTVVSTIDIILFFIMIFVYFKYKFNNL